MTAGAFYEKTAEARVADAIREIEAQTSAEVVVAVRPLSGNYRHADLTFGFLIAFAGLLLFLFHPRPIRLEGFALEFPLLFVAGTLLSASIPPLRRLFVLARTRSANVQTHARAAFVDLGIGRTRERTGILVYVSVFERTVAVVPDIGIDFAKLGEKGRARIVSLERALLPGADVDRFLKALKALKKPLARALPRRADDQNELADTVSQ
jgi:putative membrane protein